MESSSPGSYPEKYAWRNIPRQESPQRPATDRVADFHETHAFLDAATARAQACRCVQCVMPFCTVGCPFDSRIPEWLGLVAEGRFSEAAALVQTTGTLQEICAHLCLAGGTCEAMCALSEHSDPIPIAAIEDFILQYGLKPSPAQVAADRPNGLAVAIAGTGPAGLACADVLASYGYAVTLYEARGIVGGMLTSRIPSFKLEQSVVDQRLDLLRAKGVTFRTHVTVGRDVSWDDLLGSFDAIFVATGAQQPRPLEIPGADLNGWFQAVHFLLRQKLGEASQLDPISVEDKRVVVLGGGDTAMDCLRTALRCHVRSATGIYRRDAANLRASRLDFQNAVEEGAQFEFLANPIELASDARRQVAGVRCVRTQLGPSGPDGRPQPYEMPGEEFVVPADVVLVAYGFDPTPLPGTNEEARFHLSERGELCVDENRMTGVPRIFAGGELVHGANLMITSIADGYRAAHNIHRFLSPQGGHSHASARRSVCTLEPTVNSGAGA